MFECITRLLELSYGGVKQAQDDITSLFPTFYQRVKKVTQNGGVHLFDSSVDEWHFKINSGTDTSKKYDAYIHWSTLPKMIRKYGVDEDLWVKDKSKIDIRKLATKILFDVDLAITCSCPADLYWGGQYIRTKNKSNYGQELRSPDIRNPKKYGAYCKHLSALMSVLPMYVATLASFIKMYYMEDVEKVEDKLEMARKQDDVDKEKDKEEEKDKEQDIKKQKKEEEPEERPKAKKKEEPEEEEDEDETEETKESRMIGELIGTYRGRR